ncbi:hypothetical protein CDD80_6361 [Ophiocordyceps camponoti-rufipedis]|uniref:RING-type domain-containing protein n=1 Tax=Ophiocordyceps camponoti-rufipedis TaxID=2004952 RepID=A0A2C5ZFD3_9HYPO|nr:hypothetical protein CDD80_6361 [Ophiocordyceps camponoti-rufipedis]
MAEPLDRNALTEELTIQRVILESLQDEQSPDAEQEREEARREIARIRHLLEQEQAEDAPPEASPLPDEPRGLADSAIAADGRSLQASPAATDAPIVRRHGSAAFSTPPRRVMNNDFWNSPAGSPLSSRKRGRQSPGPGGIAGPAKSRRSTPRREPGLSFQSPGSSAANVIDLTGDDVDLNAACVREQIKQEKRSKQEMRDRNIALELDQSSQLRELPLPAPAPGQGHTNAFSKIMATQRSNAQRPIDDWDWPTQASSSSNAPLPPIMPGTWVDDGDSGQLIPGSHAYAAREAFGDSLRNASLPTIPQTHQPLPSFSSVSAGLYVPSAQFHHRPSFGGIPVPPVPSSMGIRDVLDRTGGFDYSSQVDADGNPFPERLSSFLQHAYHDPRVTKKDLDDLLQNIHPNIDLLEGNRDGTPAGLKDQLYRHQELALTWMKNMEEGTNKGGILADDMGLGKTISTLALMLARPPATGLPKTTLVVAPLALLTQWQEEIIKKTKSSHSLSVFLYHNKKATADELMKYDVVITTYGTVAQEYGRYDKFFMENRTRHVDMNDRTTATKFPLLHPGRAKFYRIVLDEAQCIKNKKTRTAKACKWIQATHRWCLTGTPMMNNVGELYSLVHFLRIRPYCDWDKFRDDFGTLFGGRKGDSKKIAMSKLRALLKAIMLRRKKDSQLDGKPILNLPPKTEAVVHARLSNDERGFYKQLEEKSQVQFSKYLRDGTVGKNYSNILTLLLRMRQACCHPHLNVDVDEVDTGSSEDVIEGVKNLSKSVVARIKARDEFECPICFDVVQSPTFFVPCGHDSCRDCLARLLDEATTNNLRAGNESDKAKCPQCRGEFQANKCFSYETFRSVHMPETVVKLEGDGQEADENDDDDDDDFSDSWSDREDDADANGNLRDFVVPDGSVDDFDLSSTATSSGKALNKARKGKRKQTDVKPTMLRSLRKEALKNRDAYKRYMRYLRKTWMPSAKVSECMKLLKKVQEAGEKAIVFSQWTLMLDLLQVAMWHEGLCKPERYDGGMSGDARATAARSFSTDPRVRVMLVSLKAGNAGLNLTAASTVIIVDPFWNPYTEMQAIDRAHRIGQQREVSVYRILTEQTVEDRIIELQMRKKDMVEAALDESESTKIGRLNVNELKFLFNTRD